MSATETGVEIALPKADDDLDHTVCCHDEDGVRSFCGFDVSDLPWVDSDASCVVCAELNASCYCPLFGRCTRGRRRTGAFPVSIRDEDPAPKVCPKCQGPVREADRRTEFVKDRPWHCAPCDLFSSGTATEFNRYRSAEMAAAAEAMTTRPKNGDAE